MRYLRDTSFLTWAAIVLALAGVLLFAATAGGDTRTPSPPGMTRASVISPGDSDAAAVVGKLRGLAPYGIAAGDDATTLASWGTQIAATATEGAQIRAGEGAGETDPLFAAFVALAGTGEQLAARATDPVAARSLRTAALLGIDRVANITAGLPVPDALPGAGGAQGPDPLVPPAMPDNNQAPAVPTPVPGTGHNHPTPNLHVDPPTAGDLTS